MVSLIFTLNNSLSTKLKIKWDSDAKLRIQLKPNFIFYKLGLYIYIYIDTHTHTHTLACNPCKCMGAIKIKHKFYYKNIIISQIILKNSM